MGYALAMSGEIHDWLTVLPADHPSMARLVGEALTALIEEGTSLGPPLVTELPDRPQPADLLDALDQSYGHKLDRANILRHRVAEAAQLTRDIERQIAEVEARQALLADRRRAALDSGEQDLAEEAADELAAAGGQLAELRRLLPGVTGAERRLSEKHQRLMARVDAFGARKEVMRAVYTSAQTEHAIELSGSAADTGADDRGARGGPDAAVSAADKLAEITEEIERELDLEPAAAGLKDLRPGAPGDSEVRILFAVEPPGTALLIAVLEGSDAVRDDYREAVLLSSDLLSKARAGQAPEAAAHAYPDTDSFLDEFFPGNASDVEAGAAALVARNRARTLAEQRAELGLTQAEVAARMRVRQERVSAIERAEPGATEVRTLSAYVTALGGRLEIIADFGGDRVVLR